MPTNENGSYAGKVAFVTGAGSGIGRATTLAFAREGASVVVADVSEQDNQDTARLIEAAGGQAHAVRCDVTRAEDVKAALDAAIATFGRLDAAFNNAGVEQAKKATADITEEEWDRIIGIDLRGTFLCMKDEISRERVDQPARTIYRSGARKAGQDRHDRGASILLPNDNRPADAPTARNRDLVRAAGPDGVPPLRRS